MSTLLFNVGWTNIANIGDSRRPGQKLGSMCGRFSFFARRSDVAKAFPFVRILDDFDALNPPRYNIAPTQTIPTISSEAPDAITPMHWGLVPYWAENPSIGNRMINARAESVAEKPAFRNAFRKGRRCLVLADGYYEWAATAEGKAPVRFVLRSGEPFAFAGLWERWYGDRDGPLTSATIITCPANDLSARVHDRMPVILHRNDYHAWLDPGAPLELATSLLVPFPDAEMRAYAVSRLVNSPANDTPAVIAPIAA